MAHERLRPQYFFDQERIDQLKQLAPECIEDGKINFETLRQNLGDWTQNEEDPELEHFGLFWPGKRDARRAAAIPPQGALEPVWGDGLKADGTPDTDGENDSKNVFIEGENLEVLKLLQKSYANKIKMIYIDPPYNTGNDFVYDDDFTEPLQEYLRRTGQVDEEGKPMTTNKRSDGRFHSKWLSMMYPRLRLARNLLREDGVIFVSIDDNEVNNLKILLNEIFGEENFISQLVWSGGRKNDSKFISVSHEYVLCFVKSIDYLKLNDIIWRQRKEGLEEIYTKYDQLKIQYNDNFSKIEEELKKWYKTLKDDSPSIKNKHYNRVDKKGIYFAADISWPGGGGPKYIVLHPTTNKPVKVPSRGWMFSDPLKMAEAIRDERVHFGDNEGSVPCIKSYLKDKEGQVPYSVFYQDGRAATKRLRAILGQDYFEHPKDELVLKQILEFVTDENDIILDFFAGSGTLAHAVWELNKETNTTRNFVLVQLPELLSENSLAYQDGYKTISEISLLRIKKCSSIYKSFKHKDDLGFKSFVFLGSNFKLWKNINETSIHALEEQLDVFNQNPLRENYNQNGLLYEILLFEGFTLCSIISKITEIKSNLVKKITSEYCDHSLLVCLDSEIKTETIKELQLSGADIFICLDSAISLEDKLRLSDRGMIKTI
ncbi:site-specific DNA-methyltransferase [Candidatus Woesebacteria bacterium]|nr:site-specific DNA-methyltransferase [Candidatus Woesebacteria bacterium]